MWAETKVVPSQATPRTQTQALIPDLKVAALRTSFVLILQIRAMRVATVSMMVMMA
jgi:hypothetical protein